MQCTEIMMTAVATSGLHAARRPGGAGWVLRLTALSPRGREQEPLLRGDAVLVAKRLVVDVRNILKNCHGGVQRIELGWAVLHKASDDSVPVGLLVRLGCCGHACWRSVVAKTESVRRL